MDSKGHQITGTERQDRWYEFCLFASVVAVCLFSFRYSTNHLSNKGYSHVVRLVCPLSWLSCLSFTSGLNSRSVKTHYPALLGATRGVTVSMSAFLAFHHCYCAGSSHAWGLNFWAAVCGIFWSSSSGVFSGYSGSLPSVIGLIVQPIR